MNEKYPLALPEGTVLAGQYIVEKVLGQGGFGITYEAKDHKTGERVAVKEFFPDAMATRTEQTTVLPFSGEKGENYTYGKTCFLQEAETLAKFIGNENIVRIHSYFEENGTAYFVMDFVEGTSFDTYLKQQGGKIPYEEAAQILIPIMDALSSVHSKGIVHRDVTPDNIYITKEGVVKLLDFGAARYSLGDQSRSLDVILKHGFAPKEQYTRRGKQGPYTDIYALGATFYFALTGKRPPDSVERLDEDDLVPPSSLGVQLSGAAEDAILKALSVQPADRFQSMTDFKNALLSLQRSSEQPMAAVGSPVAQTFFTAPDQTGISRTGTTGGPAPAAGQDSDLQDLAATMKTAGRLAGKLAGRVAGKMAEKTAETAGIMAGTAGKMSEIMAAKKAETTEKLTAKIAEQRTGKTVSGTGRTASGADGTVPATEGTAPGAEGGTAASDGAPAAKKPDRKKFGFIAAAALVVIALVFFLQGGRSPEKTVGAYIDAIFKGDGKLYVSLIPNELVEYACDDLNLDNKKELIKHMDEVLEGAVEYYDDNYDKWSYSYKCLDTEDYSKKELRTLSDRYEDKFDIELGGAKTVQVKLTISYDGETESETTDFLVVKIGGSWYIDYFSL